MSTAIQETAPPKTKSQALRSFNVADFPVPNGREEEWRFTPLKRLRGLASTTDVAAEAAHWPAHEYGALPAGVEIKYIGRDDARIGSVLTPFDRISALAFGAADGATLVSIAPQAVLDAPVIINRVGGPRDVAVFGHMFVEVGLFAEAVLVLDQQGTATLADNVEVSVADGAKLTFVTVADWDRDAVQAQHVKFKVGKDARVVHIHVSLGGDLVRQYTSFEYAGRGGDVEAWGLYFADAGQHLEHRLLVDHSVPDCRSYVGYRGALQGDGAHTIWVGDVLIRAEATGTSTYEINRNLVLSDGARADSVPNLEIETGEVVGAGHASTTGRFDDEHLFYLMSRGITEDEARQLVVRGFFAELLNKIPVESLKERLGQAIEARLGA